jgi:anti-sigma B factor antagonist
MDDSICKIEKEGGAAILNLVLDSILWEDSEELNKAFASLLNEGNKKIILDLSNTKYISSLILASFVVMLKRTKEAAGNLIICGLQGKAREIFSITNLDKVFDIAADRQEAIRQLAGK